MKKISYILFGLFLLAMQACQDKDIERENVKIAS